MAIVPMAAVACAGAAGNTRFASSGLIRTAPITVYNSTRDDVMCPKRWSWWEKVWILAFFSAIFHWNKRKRKKKRLGFSSSRALWRYYYYLFITLLQK